MLFSFLPFVFFRTFSLYLPYFTPTLTYTWVIYEKWLIFTKNRNLNTFKLLWWGFYPVFLFISIEKPLFTSLFLPKILFLERKWWSQKEHEWNTNVNYVKHTHDMNYTWSDKKQKILLWLCYNFFIQNFFYEIPISYNARLNFLNTRYGIYLTYERLKNTPDWTLNELIVLVNCPVPIPTKGAKALWKACFNWFFLSESHLNTWEIETEMRKHNIWQPYIVILCFRLKSKFLLTFLINFLQIRFQFVYCRYGNGNKFVLSCCCSV